MSSVIYLITGASRGIGFGLVSHVVASDPHAVVYAGARDPATAIALSDLAAAHPSRIHVVKMESTSQEDAKAAADLIKAKSGRLDVVIANAGIGGPFVDAASVPLDAMRKLFEVNTLGPLILYQAIHELLSTPTTARSGPPKFIYMSTLISSIGLNYPAPALAYGASKAAGNMVLAKIHLHAAASDLVVLCIHPGNVQTDSALAAGKRLGLHDEALFAIFNTTVGDSVQGLLKVITEAKKEEKLQFLDFQGATLPW